MKNRVFHYFLLTLLAISCVKEQQEIIQTTSDDPVFYATIEKTGDPETRVYVDDKLRVLWNSNDRVSIFNKYTYNQEYRFSGEDGDNAGSFYKVPNDEFVTGNPLDLVYAVYPYQESTKISNDGQITVILPSTQSYRENSFGQEANTMISATEDNQLLFKNLCGYLSIKLYGDNVTVASISLKGNNNEPLSGKAYVTTSVGNAPSMSFDASATNEITLSFDSPITLGTTVETATTIWLVLPPTIFSKGFTITVSDNNKGSFEKATSKEFVIKRNTLSKMSALEVVPNASYIDETGVNYGPGITIDGITWAPVNCGYEPETATSKGYPFGKLYQWGRINGQGYGYPYDSSSDSYADDSTPTIENGWRFENGSEDANTFYKPNGGYFDWDWIDDGDAKYWRQANGNKTEHDPCPLGWRVPTWQELKTLYQGNHSEWTEYKGQNGMWFSGSLPYNESAKRIFLPASGERYPYSQAQNRGTDGYYWSSNVVDYFSWSMKITSTGPGKWYMGKAYGLSVRCVRDINTEDSYISSDYSLDGRVTLIQKATYGNGIDLIIIGDAFADKDQESFYQYASFAKDALFEEEPFASMKNRFNVYVVNAISENDNVSGCTRFLTDFMGGTKVQGDSKHIFSFIREHLPQVDLTKAPICLIVNDIRYAGFCNWWTNNQALCYVPLCYNENSFSGTLKHEFGGHAFGKLLDEYYYSGTIPASLITERESWRNLAYGFYSNVDYTNDPATIQWSRFLADSRYYGLVGIYEGADTYEFGAFRPTENSIMRDNSGGYNAPSREAIYKKIMIFSEGESWNYDYETFVAFDSAAREKESKRISAKLSALNKNQSRELRMPPELYNNTVSAGESQDVTIQ